MPELIDITGKQFGNWFVIKQVTDCETSSHSTSWLCRCVCGTERVRLKNNLSAGKNIGCGCRHWAQKRPYEALFNELLRNARKDDRHVSLNYEGFLGFVGLDCHYCGATVKWAKKHIFRNGNNYNLDRKDNDLGYTKDNCVVCCARCNRAKSNHFTYEQWIQIGALIRSWKK